MLNHVIYPPKQKKKNNGESWVHSQRPSPRVWPGPPPFLPLQLRPLSSSPAQGRRKFNHWIHMSKFKCFEKDRKMMNNRRIWCFSTPQCTIKISGPRHFIHQSPILAPGLMWQDGLDEGRTFQEFAIRAPDWIPKMILPQKKDCEHYIYMIHYDSKVSI